MVVLGGTPLSYGRRVITSTTRRDEIPNVCRRVRTQDTTEASMDSERHFMDAHYTAKYRVLQSG